MPLLDDDYFSYLDATRNASFALHDIVIPRTNRDDVVLELRYGGESNKRYQGALKSTHQKMSGQPEETLRKAIASLIAKHLVVGWANVLDKFGTPVAFSSEGIEEILHALIDRNLGKIYLVPLAMFVADPANFREPIAQAADLGNE